MHHKLTKYWSKLIVTVRHNTNDIKNPSNIMYNKDFIAGSNTTMFIHLSTKIKCNNLVSPI